MGAVPFPPDVPQGSGRTTTGSLNVIALPRDWANYGAVIDAFMAKYPEITITEQSPDISSAEEIQAAKTSQAIGGLRTGGGAQMNSLCDLDVRNAHVGPSSGSGVVLDR